MMGFVSLPYPPVGPPALSPSDVWKVMGNLLAIREQCSDDAAVGALAEVVEMLRPYAPPM